MDSKWFDREQISRDVEGIDFSQLSYDYELYRYTYRGMPFTGCAVSRYDDLSLESVGWLVDGLAEGITVVWYPSGQIESYCEMMSDACHGLCIEWAEDGTKKTEARYHHGSKCKDTRFGIN